MKNLNQSLRVLRWSTTLFLLALMVLPAQARSHKSYAWARSRFDTAEHLRDSLNFRQAADRTRRQYQQVIEAYRKIYFGAPASGKADPSAVAAADLMAEMGRRFQDEAILRKAIRQYEFARREYPTSRERFDALFAIGTIYKDDLKDSAHAKATFEEFLQKYPRHHLADDARQALNASSSVVAAKTNVPAGTQSPDKADASTSSSKTEKTAADSPSSSPAAEQKVAITGVQHWSNAEYTRVAIALGDNVNFQSQRLNNPDRIYFDLRETKLPSRLNGKTYAVNDNFLKKIRIAQFGPKRTRIVLEVSDRSVYEAFLTSNPTRLMIDIHNDHSAGTSSTPGSTPGSTKNASAPEAVQAQEPRAPTEKPSAAAVKASSIRPTVGAILAAGISPPAIPEPGIEATPTTSNIPKKKIVVADDDDPLAIQEEPALKRSGKAGLTAASERSKMQISRSTREARPTASGDRSLIRALGLKIGKIVIDAGHGGHDTGTIGPKGLQEKDLVLDVALRLGILLKTKLGAEVEYTRDDDTFVPLETRTAIANQSQADLFISVHANSSRDPDARGVETYYLNFTSSRDALEVAARENSVSDQSIHELQDLVKKIALKEKIEESREFASNVETALHSGLSVKNPGLRDRGVKKAPFIVLIGANMPSILAEISFVSNPADERKLMTSAYRQRIAESLYQGVSKYVSGLSGVKVASKIDKATGQ